jgi:hypothetical protein
MRCSDSKGLGNPGEEFARAKVWQLAKPRLRAQSSQLLPGSLWRGHVTVSRREITHARELAAA